VSDQRLIGQDMPHVSEAPHFSRCSASAARLRGATAARTTGGRHRRNSGVECDAGIHRVLHLSGASAIADVMYGQQGTPQSTTGLRL
jgi:hypothetical protein